MYILVEHIYQDILHATTLSLYFVSQCECVINSNFITLNKLANLGASVTSYHHPVTCSFEGDKCKSYRVFFRLDFYRLPQGKSRLGRGKLTSAGDMFGLLCCAMLCYAL